MNNKTVFVRTSKGEAEASGQTSLLFGDAKRAFMLVNNKSNVDELRKHAAPSLRPLLEDVLEQLESDGFIGDKNDVDQKKSSSGAGSSAPKMAVPKMAVPTKAVEPEKIETSEEEELDFTNFTAAPRQDAGADKARAGAEIGKGAAEELDFSSIMQMPGQNAAAEKAKAEAEARMRAEAEAKAKAEAEAKARAEAEAKARARAEMEAKMRAEAEAKARAETEAKARAEIDAKLRAEVEARTRAEAEAKARARAEMEAKLRAEAEAKARAEAEARMRAEVEAKARARVEMEAKARVEAEAKARAEAEARARAEAEARARTEAEAKIRAEAEAKAKVEAETKTGVPELDFSSILKPTSLDAEADADRARVEAEARARMEIEARMRAEEEAKIRVLAEAEAKTKAEAEARAKLRAELEAGILAQESATGKHNAARSMIATVLFFDVVGYTKQSVAKQIELKGQFNTLISGFIGHVGEDQRIILDTGDGAAIGFLQHPEDALDVAMKFRAVVTANGHRDYPELKVRAGIHLGPVNVVKDMNGQLNMVGDGINDAQRIMSFAGMDQIYVSRAYFDVISRLTADSARLFKYNGTQKDKHGREHQVYLVLGEGAPTSAYDVNQQSGGLESLMSDLSSLMKDSANLSANQEPSLNFSQFKMGTAPEVAPQPAKSPQEIEAEAQMAAKLKAEQAAEAARIKAQQDAAAIRAKAEHDAARAKQEEAAHKLAADQARAFDEAEKRAKERAEAEAAAHERTQELEAKQAGRQASAPASKASRPRKVRQPMPWIKIGVTLVILAVVTVVALPYALPMQDYVARVELVLSDQLKQPVHIGSMSAASLPMPKLELHDVTVGSGKELKIEHVALYFDVLTLLSNVKTINKAELDKVEVSAESFTKALPWMQAMGANPGFPVARVMLRGVHVTGDVPQIPALGGNMDFDAYGRFSKVSLSSDDGKLGVVVQPQEGGRMQLEVLLTDTHLPLLPNIQFSSLDATGDVGSGAINFTSISGNLYGGTLKGSANLGWQGGWQLQGHLNLKFMPVEKALPGLKIAGELEGDASLGMAGAKLTQLTSAPHLEGTLQIKDGAFNNMDIGETARSGRKQLVVGVTHFDTLNSSVLVDSSGSHLKQVKIAAGSMIMNGSADAATNGQLTGQLLVDMNKVRAGMGTLSLSLGGTVADPAWRIGR